MGEQREAAATEIRLGLVCYGGVSLAVYMYGVTAEIFALVRASRALERDATPAATSSEAVYLDALRDLAEQGHPRTVVVDAVSGTSAGGINGVCLARGLAAGRRLEGFRKLWIEQGDIWSLVAGWAPTEPGQGVLGRVRDALTGLPSRLRTGALDGDHMSRLVFGALRDMEPLTDPPGSVVDDVDLFVTATDVHGYDVAVPTGAGGVSAVDHSYRQVLAFHGSTALPPPPAGTAVPTTRPSGAYGEDTVPALAFAARATSSFPGAFPAVSVGTFARDVAPLAGSGPVDEAAIASHFVYGDGYGRPAQAWYMDGGVLDNAPFDHLLDAIAAKRAENRVRREIVYVEPDPHRDTASDSDDERPPEPSAKELVAAARGTIPTHNSLVEVLERLREMNAGISTVGAIVAAEEGAVTHDLENADLLGGGGSLTYDEVVARAVQARELGAARAGVGFHGYAVLRQQAIAELLAGPIARDGKYPPRSAPAAFVRAVLQAWAGADMTARLARSGTPAELAATVEDHLGRIDLPYRIRRAQLLIRRLGDLLGEVNDVTHRDQLVTMKSACWDHLEALRRRAEDLDPVVLEASRSVFGPDALRGLDRSAPSEFAAARADDLRAVVDAYRASGSALTGSSRELWETFRQNTKEWPAPAASRLLSPYVGFPLWDVAIFPVIALAELPQLTPMGVTRFSPLDAAALRPSRSGRWPWSSRRTGAPKLQGIPLHHFGAFFSRAARENDYLWGRLDGAELLLRLLSRRSGDVDLGNHLRRALTTILDAESELTTTEDLVADLREQLADPAWTMPSTAPGTLG